MDPLGLKERNAMSSVCNTYPYQSLLEKSDEIYHYTSLGTLQIILNKKQFVLQTVHISMIKAKERMY